MDPGRLVTLLEIRVLNSFGGSRFPRADNFVELQAAYRIGCDECIFSRMRSRRVPVLRLGSRGPGGDARWLRLCPQAFASVRNRSQCVGLAGETKIVAKRRIVVTFYVSHYKSVSSHTDRGGRVRETQNCRHFWTRLASSRLKSVNNHRDRGGRGREAQNCRHFWIRLGSSCLVAKRRIVVTFGLVSGLRVSKVSTVTGVGGVVVAKPRIVVTFGLVSGYRVSKVSTVTGIGGVVVEKPRIVVTFGLVAGLRVSKVSTVTGIRGVVVAKHRIVVTFGLVSGLRVSKVSTVTRIGERREKR